MGIDKGKLTFINSSNNTISNLALVSGGFADPKGDVPYMLEFQGGAGNLVDGLQLGEHYVWGAVRIAGSTVSIKRAVLSVWIIDDGTDTYRSRYGMWLTDGAHVAVEGSIISGFTEGIRSESAFLTIKQSALVRNTAAGLATYGYLGPEPELSCHQVLICGVGGDNAPGSVVDAGPINDACPIIDSSLIAMNRGAGIRIDSTEKLQVTNSNIDDNGEYGIDLEGLVLDAETFISNSNLRRNGRLWVPHSNLDNHPIFSTGSYELFSNHRVGRLPVSQNYWGVPGSFADLQVTCDRYPEHTEVDHPSDGACFAREICDQATHGSCDTSSAASAPLAVGLDPTVLDPAVLSTLKRMMPHLFPPPQDCGRLVVSEQQCRPQDGCLIVSTNECTPPDDHPDAGLRV
jgi:hypothetical protein